MTPKEKAIELVKKTHPLTYTAVHAHNTTGEYHDAKKISLIAVDEIVKECGNWIGGGVSTWDKERFEYWQEVKQEIEKL